MKKKKNKKKKEKLNELNYVVPTLNVSNWLELVRKPIDRASSTVHPE